MISITPRNFDWGKTNSELETRINERRKAHHEAKLTRSKLHLIKDPLSDLVGPVQLVPQGDWTDCVVFNGCTVPNLCHPHHRLLWHRILQNYKPKHDVLLVMSCIGSKPYSASRLMKQMVHLSKLGWFDMAVMSFHPVPIEPLDASLMYPNIMYDWPHTESDSMMHVHAGLSASMWIEFLSRHHYKKVIFCLSQYDPHIEALQKIMKALPDIEMVNMYDSWQPLHGFIYDHYTSRGNAITSIWKYRFHGFKTTREFISHELGDPKGFRCDAKLD